MDEELNYRRSRIEVWRRMTTDVLLLLSLLGVFGGGGYAASEIKATRDAVQLTEGLDSRQESRLQEIEKKLSYFEGREAAEHPHRGPVGACLCVNESPPGPDFLARMCSVAPECDEAALTACQALNPGYRCKSIL